MGVRLGWNNKLISKLLKILFVYLMSKYFFIKDDYAIKLAKENVVFFMFNTFFNIQILNVKKILK